MHIGICATLSRIHVDPESGHFLDEHGRVRMFRGINSVEKGFPWYDHKMLNTTRHEQLSNLGFNVVRLGTMWTGVEPHEGQINETYVGILEVNSIDINNFKVP